MSKVKNIVLCAVMMALTFAVTRFIQIPIPLGYFNVGNSVILFGCCLLPMPYGIFMGAVGSALADLTSYPVYTIPTLIIKALMPLVFYLLLKLPVKNHIIRHGVAFVISTLIPLVGYTATGCFLYGGLIAGLAQLPGLAIEYVANIALFMLLYSLAGKQLKKVLHLGE